MSVKKLLDVLNNLKEEDIMDFGEDYEGNPLFLIKSLSSNPSLLTVGNIEASDIPEW